MPKIHPRLSAGKNHIQPLPLFDWANRHEQARLSIPERRIARRFRLSSGHARIIAELAGFRLEERS